MGLPEVAQTGKETPCSAGDLDSIPGLERSPGEGNSNPLQYSCLENSMDREDLQATVSPCSSKKVGQDCVTNTVTEVEVSWVRA